MTTVMTDGVVMYADRRGSASSNGKTTIADRSEKLLDMSKFKFTIDEEAVVGVGGAGSAPHRITIYEAFKRVQKGDAFDVIKALSCSNALKDADNRLIFLTEKADAIFVVSIRNGRPTKHRVVMKAGRCYGIGTGAAFGMMAARFLPSLSLLNAFTFSVICDINSSLHYSRLSVTKGGVDLEHSSLEHNTLESEKAKTLTKNIFKKLSTVKLPTKVDGDLTFNSDDYR